MIIDHSRDKLANAIIYFRQNTNHCYKIKLFKLLYMLDFEHYRDIGRSVTDLNYFAWDNGPVPTDLYYELENPGKDLTDKVKLELVPFGAGKTKLEATPKQQFDPGNFTKRELEIMRRLANEFKNHLAEDMIFETHLENKPWHQVYEVQGNKSGLIPYELALKNQEKEELLDLIKDEKQFMGIVDSL